MKNNYQLAHDLLDRYVRALIKVQGINYLEIIGSGFVVKDSNNLFLVTAAHLFDHYNESTPICINSANGKLVLIDGISQSSKSEDGIRANDQVDISIILLEEKCAEKLAGTSFLDIKQFDLSANSKYPFGYWALGYPLTKNKGNILHENFEARTYIINVQEASDDSYSQMELNKEDNLLLHFDERRVYSETNEKRNAYSIRGLSGCPVWGLGVDGKFKLVSILIEHHQKVHQTIVTTRIKKIVKI